MSRIWAPCKPVLHMAIALNRLHTWTDLAGTREWLEAALSESRFWKEKLPLVIPGWKSSEALPLIVFDPPRPARLI
jgi:hypothetical protein